MLGLLTVVLVVAAVVMVGLARRVRRTTDLLAADVAGVVDLARAADDLRRAVADAAARRRAVSDSIPTPSGG